MVLQRKNITTIVSEKDMDSLLKFGGIRKIAEALRTDLETGISGNDEDLCSRRKPNTLSKSQPPMLQLLGLLLKSCNNYIIFLLLISAGMSLGFGINEEGARTGWWEGAIIFVAVIILVVAPYLRDYWYTNMHKFKGGENLWENREVVVDVVRGGCSQHISISDVVFGEIVCLQRGCQIPADGLFISGELLEVDDGSESINDQNPFLFYGTKVINGNGHMLVTSIGVDTAWGNMMAKTRSPNTTGLQAQLDKMSTRTQILGLIISILITIVLFLRFKLLKEKHKYGLPELKGRPIPSNELMGIIKKILIKPSGKLSNLTTSLIMCLVGIVEGLPFIITIALSYWNKKTFQCKAFAQKLSACIEMGSVTSICTDKTGGLTLNPMEVVDMCFIGEEFIRGDSVIAPNVHEALCDGINSPFLNRRTPFSSESDPFLSWAERKLGMKKKKMESLQQSCILVLAKEVDSVIDVDESGILMRKNRDNAVTMSTHWRGDAKKIVSMCSRYVDIKGKTMLMEEDNMSIFREKIEYMQSKDLKTIAFAYKETHLSLLEESDLTLIGLLGLKHTCRIDTKKSIEYCRNAGIDIKLISEDNVSVLTIIAEKYGMLVADSNEVMKLEAGDFRSLDNDERINVVDQVVLMGASLPADRLLVVQCLRQKGHRVAVVGVTTAEIPALIEADVGIAMGTWSTELARRNSDIIICNGDFNLVVSIIRSGRCAYENIRKYIQFQLTMTIAWLIISPATTFLYGQSPINAVQWIWASLIVTIFGGLALLTEPPEQELMKKSPANPTKPLINKSMWINIVTQALYQATILVTFVHIGSSILGISPKICSSMIFNSFVLCQVFNQFNSRELERRNAFKRLHQNYLFWVAIGVTLALQEAFTEIASLIVDSARLNAKQWAICFLIGIVSWAINLVVKCASKFMKYWFILLTGMTHPASSESTLNLELPLMNEQRAENLA